METRPARQSEALAAMRRARAALVAEHPFFGDLALRLVLAEDPSCRDLWSDGRTLACNPLFAASISQERLAGAQAHEVLHLVFGHHLRRRGREKALWNRACDLAVNGVLVDAGFLLPDGFLYDADLAGRTADEIYDVLLSRISRDEKCGRSVRGKGSPQGGAVRDAPPGGSVRLGLPTPGGGGGGALDGERKERSRQEGSAVRPVDGRTGARRKAEGSVPRFDGEVRDLPELAGGRDGADGRRKAELDAETALARAVSRARRMGALPAGLERLVRNAVPAGLDWRETLARFLSACADSDYTWTVPNRRHLWQDIYMPSRWEQRLTRVAVAVDCSGSVDEGTLALFLGELRGVLDAYDATLTVLFHDTEVHAVRTVSRFDAAEDLVPVGGGGTDFRPVPEALAREGIEPVCLLWFTDLECTRFPEEPDYPVLWVCPRGGGETPPFGEVVRMDGEARGTA